MQSLRIEKLTKKKLEATKGRVFESGVSYYPSVNGDKNFKWVAVRGYGFPDWAIYYGEESESLQQIAQIGGKITSEKIIRKLVPCDNEAFEMYRY